MTRFITDNVRVRGGLCGRTTVTLLFASLAILGASCSSTRTTSFANTEVTAPTPITSVVTLMVDDRSYLRAAVENHMTGRLRQRGLEAHSSYRKVPVKALDGSKEEAREALSVWGADAVLVSRLTDRTDLEEAPQFVSTTSGWEEAWEGSSRRTQFQASPWGGEVTVIVHLESKLYRLSDAELLWVGYTETKLKEFTDDMERIRSVSRQIVDQLAKDDLIQ